MMRYSPYLILAGLLAFPNSAAADTESLFREQVAPLLETRCLRCHGQSKPKGGLSLATAKGLGNGSDTGVVVEPGKPEASLLMQAITGDKPRMPRGAAPLSAGEVASIRRWIADGARWPDGLTLQVRAPMNTDWWSLRPLTGPATPAVKDAAAVRNPIDAFVLAKLQTAGLTPSPEADRRTLIRRLTFDLHGLPPTPEEVAAYVNDADGLAYEKLVDRLLASPRYGERWGRHWLDVVHYGDTHGYDKDKRRDNAWPYRDYIIRSLNADKPYAQFIKEQVAGDVLVPGEPDGIIATGFIAAGPWDFVGHVELREGTVEKAKTRLIDRDDMVSNTIATFMSLTIHCARCHDHKFDPIPQRDYYQLQAVFAGVDRGDRPYADLATACRRAELNERNKALEKEALALRDKVNAESNNDLGRLEQEAAKLRQHLTTLPSATPKNASPTNGYHSAVMPKQEETKWVQIDLGQSIPLELIRLHPARPTDFPDTPGFGFPARFRVEIGDDATFAKAETVADHSQADFPNPGDVPWSVTLSKRPARYVRITATKLWPRTNDYVFALAEAEVLSDGKNVAAKARVTAKDSIEAGRWSTKYLVDGFTSRQELTEVSDAKMALVREQRTAAERRLKEIESQTLETYDKHFHGRVNEFKRLTDESMSVRQQIQALPLLPKVYAVVPRPPQVVHVLNRGDVEKPGELVQPGGLSCIAGPQAKVGVSAAFTEGQRRAALADWIADTRNPLTWRSIVNRVWHYHFGRGLVDTPSDFGRNGSLPSHPELLDWLAAEFRDNGQSPKQLHRLIVTSATYRQASAHRPEAAKADADNRLLWRMNRSRLDAEEVRDAVLAISGQMRWQMGGPGFELFRFKDDHSPVYDHSALEKINDPSGYRRSVYRFVVRSVPNPFLECLDCADPNINTPVRSTTLTALQALALLNDAFMLRQSELLAERLRMISDNPSRQIEAAYLSAFGRPPTTEEKAALTSYAAKHGLANACRLLFNTNEFVFVD
jgi:hypothetical protein